MRQMWNVTESQPLLGCQDGLHNIGYKKSFTFTSNKMKKLWNADTDSLT
jgi:hypothetical protein